MFFDGQAPPDNLTWPNRPLYLHPRMDRVVSMSGTDKPRLRLKTAKFDELAAAVIGARTDRELAERLGVGANHLSQIRVGARTPGAHFIAAVTSAMPNVPFEQLFEIVESVEASEVA